MSLTTQDRLENALMAFARTLATPEPPAAPQPQPVPAPPEPAPEPAPLPEPGNDGRRSTFCASHPNLSLEELELLMKRVAGQYPHAEATTIRRDHSIMVTFRNSYGYRARAIQVLKQYIPGIVIQ